MAQQDTGSEADKERLRFVRVGKSGRIFLEPWGKPVCLVAQTTI